MSGFAVGYEVGLLGIVLASTTLWGRSIALSQRSRRGTARGSARTSETGDPEQVTVRYNASWLWQALAGVRARKANMVRWAGAIVGIAAVGLLDWVTGTEMRVFPLYFLPISLGAWSSRRRGAIGLAALATAAWMASNVGAGASHWSILAFNSGMQAVAFGVTGYLIAELRRRLERERELSRVDPLTGLLNRRAFDERAGVLLALARRHPRPTAMAFLDLDNFKTVNDTKGHEAGDEVLRAVASVLRASVRTADVVARVGGDEFVLLLPETDAASAMTLLERLRASLGETMHQGGWPVSASVGVLCLTTAPPSLDALFDRSDSLMYAAKRGGKDRVHLDVLAAADS